jgi:hypothetical protein
LFCAKTLWCRRRAGNVRAAAEEGEPGRAREESAGARSPIFSKPTRFFGNRILLPSEPLWPEEARAGTFDYSVRIMMLELAALMERYGNTTSGQLSRRVLVEGDGPGEQLWMDVIGNFLTLPNVADDGRSRRVTGNSSNVAVLLVAVWTGAEEPTSDAETLTYLAPRCSDLKRLKAMLMRNATLLSDDANRSTGIGSCFVPSLLTHVAAPELDYSVQESCWALDCTVESARYRCGRCLVARFCVREHMEPHWKEPSCVLLVQREPKISLDCARGYLDNPENAELLGVDCVAVPRKAVSGLVTIKVQLFRGTGFKICDPCGLLVLMVNEEAAEFQQLRQMFLLRATAAGGVGFGYFDADMSQQGRLDIFFDHSWKFTW